MIPYRFLFGICRLISLPSNMKFYSNSSSFVSLNSYPEYFYGKHVFDFDVQNNMPPFEHFEFIVKVGIYFPIFCKIMLGHLKKYPGLSLARALIFPNTLTFYFSNKGNA